ncbi:hypothetical protein SARC_06900 [Sphaeroforma arctica JP610]|uniref:Glycosyl transferase 64 domain-containing protein n=1 Tax=Sphaeroforma arctica JP610 TaxID=667725 RepID=A0A0L0FXQ2_9EUKA|nr:hypothetical protein SARC_06900 [Sphaeroforma arctica JP610]KNC80743.1 hypothetical protein SARC_06900 [Sphaeroforma arctica JP610]|eukprot:XP_014154645.1 hypothetical protein SARC_06900 [Sphaeroforma arctica JP610]
MQRASRSTSALNTLAYKPLSIVPRKGKSLRATLQWWGTVVFIIAIMPVVYVAVNLYISHPRFRSKLGYTEPTPGNSYQISISNNSSINDDNIVKLAAIKASSTKFGPRNSTHTVQQVLRQDVRGKLAEFTSKTQIAPVNALDDHHPNRTLHTKQEQHSAQYTSHTGVPDLLPYPQGREDKDASERSVYYIKPFNSGKVNHRTKQVTELDTYKITVVISTFKQPACLTKQLRIWSKCDIVHSIRVNWFEGNEDIPFNWPKLDSNGPKVILDELPDKLSYRFWPRRFVTEGVFTVDVDTFYSCTALKAAFALWKLHPKSAVGFHARQLDRHRKELWYESYSQPYPRNSLLITKGGIQHRDAYTRFFMDYYRTQRLQVDKYVTGEDYLMAFVQAIHFDPIVKFVCAGVAHSCHAECMEGKVGSLGSRTSRSRKTMLRKLFTEFGDPFVTLTGPENMLRLEAEPTPQRPMWGIRCFLDYLNEKEAPQADDCQSKPMSDNSYNCMHYFDPDHVDAEAWYNAISGPDIFILAVYIGLYMSYLSS